MKKIFLFFILFGICLNAIPCMLVGEVGTDVKSNIEDIAIFWDAEKKYENHIRQINMQTSGNSVAFIVPLPSVPKVYEVQDNFFDNISAKLIAPRVTKKEWKPGNLPLFFITVIRGLSLENLLENMVDKVFSKADDLRANGVIANSISVLQEIEVAGFNVKTIMATDIEGLELWLKKHSFPFKDNHREWLSYYIQKKWPLTIFHFNKSKGDQNLVTKTIGLGFKTEMPIHPYKEPKRLKKANGSRKFKVYFFADNTVSTKLDNDNKWSGSLLYSSKLQLSHYELEGIPTNKEKPYWLTVFSEDRIDRGNDTDIVFTENNKNKEENNIPPIINKMVEFYPFDLVLLLALCYFKRKKLKRVSIIKKVMYVSLWYFLSFCLATFLGFLSLV